MLTQRGTGMLSLSRYKFYIPVCNLCYHKDRMVAKLLILLLEFELEVKLVHKEGKFYTSPEKHAAD